ncbi:MAG: TRAP transporter substrate-binding protein [Clostridiales Family XIII bacterium]|jgi:C4-dicarboxylate-binding protein DctP|nr:TRAP transporter substrate-binding protein [Clostridiales Family XIII bacterium]
MIARKSFGALAVFVSLCLLVGALAACGGNGGGAESPAGTETAATGTDGGTAAETPRLEEIDLKIAHPHPAGSDADNTYQNIKKFADEYSDGAIQIEVFPAGSLVNSNEMFQSVLDGTVDIGHVVNADAATAIPATSLLDVPGVIRPGIEDMMKLIDPMQPLFERSGFRLLAPTPLGPLDILCDTKFIKTPADMKGLTLRATGKYVGEAVQNWGGSPASIPLTDLPTALERHTVDAVLLDGLAVQMFKMYENQQYVVKTKLQGAVSFVLMNLDKWNSLSPEHREIIQRAVNDATAAADGSTTALVDQLDKEMAENGNDVYELTDEETNVFLEAAKPALDAAIAAGGADGEALYRETLKIRGE